METIIVGLNSVLRGWFEYFKHSHKWTFYRLDQWIRRRLRSIMRKRYKRHGISRGGNDNNRWPNKFFQDRGLSLSKPMMLYSSPHEVTPPTGEPDAGDSARPVREGGAGLNRLFLPLSGVMDRGLPGFPLAKKPGPFKPMAILVLAAAPLGGNFALQFDFFLINRGVKPLGGRRPAGDGGGVGLGYLRAF